MKLAVAVCLAVTVPALAACSSAGGSNQRLMPETPLSANALNASSSDKLKLTGFYPVPAFGAVGVFGLTNGPKHGIWFTEFNTDGIGNITTAGVVTVYATGANSQPDGIAESHSHRRIWAGGYGGLMISSKPSGAQTDYPIPGAHIGGVVVGPDKNIWFADYGNNKLGRITHAGVVTEFALPSGAQPIALAVGKDKNFWIVDDVRNKIIKVNSSGVVLHSYGHGITTGESPSRIVAAPDGNLYFSEGANSFTVNDKIARITLEGKIEEIGNIPPASAPNQLAVGKDKNVYFAMGRLQAVGKITLATSKVTFSYLPMTNDQGTNAILEGPDERLWLGANETIYAVSY
jgi:virginiamycin B lyase